MRPLLQLYACDIGHFLDQSVISVKSVACCVHGSAVVVYLGEMNLSSKSRLLFEDSYLCEIWSVVVVY